MATIVKRMLSGSEHGFPIGITATAGATLNTIHTGVTGTGVTDEITLYAHNNYSQALDLVLEFGTTATNAHIVTTIPARGDGLLLVLPGIPLQGSATASTISAYVSGLNGSASAGATSTFITVTGFVNRITQ